MSELKRTILYQAHLDAGATMVDFGGWDMPIKKSTYRALSAAKAVKDWHARS